jgi:hypothetical protein
MRGLSNSGLVVGVGSAKCVVGGACASTTVSVGAMLMIVGVLGNGGVDWKPIVRTVL